MLQVTPDIFLQDSELEETFVRSGGPGGQNVNKVATAVQLRFDVRQSQSLPAAVRARLLRLAAARITTEGVLVIIARRFRTQEQNREDARQRLSDWVRKAATPPKPRKPTRMPKAVKQRRLDDKRQHGDTKRRRRIGPSDTE